MSYWILIRPYPGRDYDYAERAALALASAAASSVQEQLRDLSRLATLIGIAGSLAANLAWVWTNQLLSLGSNAAPGMIVACCIAGLALAAYWFSITRISIPRGSVDHLLAAGLCGRCRHRLPPSDATKPMRTCRRCRLSWLRARVGESDPNAIRDRRRRRTTHHWAKDWNERSVPLAAAFDGDWPTSTTLPDATSPQERRPWAQRLLAQQRNSRLFLIAGFSPLTLTLSGIWLPDRIAFFVVLGVLFVIMPVMAVVVWLEAKRSMENGANAVIKHWLSRWRCPCCDGDFAKSGRWQRWGAASIVCDRCRCVWQLPFERAVAPRDINCCGKCGYDLAGLDVAAYEACVCPECGTPVRSVTTLRCCGCNAVLAVRGDMTMHAIPCGACGTINDARWSIPGSIRPPELFGTGTDPMCEHT